MIFYNWDRLTDESLDITEESEIIMITERVGYTTCTSTTSTTDTVNVGLRYIRDIIVDHMFKRVDIDTARGNICCDEDSGFLFLKIRECALSIVL